MPATMVERRRCVAALSGVATLTLVACQAATIPDGGVEGRVDVGRSEIQIGDATVDSQTAEATVPGLVNLDGLVTRVERNADGTFSAESPLVNFWDTVVADNGIPLGDLEAQFLRVPGDAEVGMDLRAAWGRRELFDLAMPWSGGQWYVAHDERDGWDSDLRWMSDLPSGDYDDVMVMAGPIPDGPAAFPPMDVDKALILGLSSSISRHRALNEALLAGTESPAAVHSQLATVLEEVIGLGIEWAPIVSEDLRPSIIRTVALARSELYDSVVKLYPGALTRAPEFYRGVVKNSEGAVSIRLNQRIQGSGALVAPDLVVTNRHVADLLVLRLVKVEFDYEVGPSAQQGFPMIPATPSRCDVEEVVLSTDPDLDLAALKLSNCELTLADRTGRVLALSERATQPDESMYVIGHPNNSPQEVADNSRLIFPHSIEQQSVYDALRDSVGGADPDNQDAAALEAFDSSYVSAGDGTWHFHSPGTRWSGAAGSKYRIFGLASNTYPGNSGSPVFFANDHHMAGVFLGGAANFNEELSATWWRHEAAIPVEVVVEWLRTEGLWPE